MSMSDVRLVTTFLKSELLEAIEKSSGIYLLPSFLMKSGVELLLPSLKKAEEHGADIQICTGDYLYVTQPDALALLLTELKSAKIRLWQSNGISFHPKAYLFSSEKEKLAFVGSSNFSRSAMTTGVEWNVKVEKSKDFFAEAVDEFSKLMYHERTIPLNEETLKNYIESYHHYHQKYPQLVRQWTKQEEIELTLPTEEEKTVILDERLSYSEIIPRPAQQEALEELEKTFDEGYNKAMVVMATGLGKTYLAAFFAKRFKKVLFVAHREEILKQAETSFLHVMPKRTTGLYYGKEKNSNADCVFASIFTLALKENLEAFAKQTFDLIIIDEFHHAAADSYERVINYFEPQFLLGITATPYRMDGKDVFAICDGNVAYQLHFIEAIQKNWLTPFQYYGVYDDIDYSSIRWIGTKYDSEQLLAKQLQEEHAQKIFDSWKKYKQTRTLVFCSSIRQADFLQDYFQKQSVQGVSLHSKSIISREEVIQQLKQAEIELIFTVDLFNEGVDIPEVDTLLFVRPTESLAIFTQQVGRGLRLHDGKTHCTIIDLIGNYRNADVKLQLFDTTVQQGTKKEIEPVVPTNCGLYLDTKVIDLLGELHKKRQPRKEKLRQAFDQLKEELGRRPTYLEMHLKGEGNAREFRQEFKSYVGFLYWAGELKEAEQSIFLTYEKWLQEVEKTSMTKSYKMVVLKAMLERGPEKWYAPISSIEVSPFFHQYYMEKEYRKRIDFSDKASKKLWDYNQEKVAKLIERMPMTKWSGSSKGLLQLEGNVLSLSFDVGEKDSRILFEWTKEICDYRLAEYFERKENK